MRKRLKTIFADADKKEILSKGSSFLVIRTLGLLAGYLFAISITRIYGAGVYGLVSLSFALFIIGGILGRMGLDINLVRFYASAENLGERGIFYKVLFKSLLFSGVLGFAMYFFRESIAVGLFKKPQLEPYIFWTALALPFWALTMLSGGVLRARKKNKWFAFLNNPGRFFFSFALLMVFWALLDDPLSAIKAHFFGVAALGLMGLVMAFKTLEGLSMKTRVNSWGFLRDALPMMLSSTILVLLGWLDTFVLGIYESDEQIGIYNAALKIATLTSFSLQAINSILAPKLADLYARKEMKTFHTQIGFTAKLNFFLTLGVVVVILLLHPWILGIFGSVFVTGSGILIVLCLGQLVNALSGSVGVIMQMTGNQKAYQYIVLVALVLNGILNFTLTPIYGGFGAAIATVISMVSWNVLGALYLKRRLDIRSYYWPF